MDVDSLERWVETHQPDPSLEYGHGWWNGIEFIRMLRDRHRLEAVDVPATYWMETPYPRELDVVKIRDFGAHDAGRGSADPQSE